MNNKILGMYISNRCFKFGMSFNDNYFKNISKCVEIRDWDDVLSRVKMMREILDLTERENRKYCIEKTIGIGLSEVLDVLSYVMQVAVEDLKNSNFENGVHAITECYRFLRNACAIPKVQNYIDNTSIFENTSNILYQFYISRENHIECLKVIIQFIGNSVVGNYKNKLIVWHIFSPHFKKLLTCSDSSVTNYSCMVLYNIFKGELDGPLEFITTNIPLLVQCHFNGNEFALFVLESLLGKEENFEEIYHRLDIANRLKILDVIRTLLLGRDDETPTKICFPLNNLLFLVNCLKKHADNILTIVDDNISGEPRETLQLLDVVACASSSSLYLPSLQADRSLLICVACLLKNVIQIGKAEGGNIFTIVQRLSELKVDSGSVKEHPVFGFKVSLVRLLGNLCHQHAENQNQVRELECLPAILDTCNIDVYNPLLLQWGILAVRNLLENNSVNQRIIANLIAKGPAQNAVLQELGVELHEDELGTLSIAPLMHV